MAGKTRRRPSWDCRNRRKQSPDASKSCQERRSLRMAKNTAVKITLIFSLLVLSHGIVSAQATTPPPQTFGTTIYFDYTNFLSKSGPISSNAKNSFFAFRRAYFTYENRINDNLRFRFRYDADSTANLTSVDLTKGSTKKDDKLRPFIKHLYLEYSNLLPNSTIKVGLAETIQFKFAEDRWGYRSCAT